MFKSFPPKELCFSTVLSQEQGQLDGVKMRATDGDADQEGRCPVAGRSACSEAGPPSSHPISTWSFTPGTHKSPFTSASSLLPAPGSPFSHLPTLAPLPSGTEAIKVPPQEHGMYLWTGLFHEALFEIVPGDEGHKLWEERHTLTPCLPPQEAELPQQTWAPRQRGKFAMGKDVCTWLYLVWIQR